MAANFNDIMDDGDSFALILGNQVAGTTGFGLSARGVIAFRDDYDTARDLMDSDEKQIKQVIKNINSIYRDHDTANRRCYINAVMTKPILAFYYWTVYAIKEGGARYDEDTVSEFHRDWVNSIMDSYTMEKPEVTTQSTTFSVPISKYNGTNWFDVRGQITQLMSTRIRHAGIPLSYVIRSVREEWEDTEYIASLQDRRIATKTLTGPTFDLDNKEVFRILTNVLSGTTLEDDVNKFKRTTHGRQARDSLTAIVEGASYPTELKRQGDAIIKELFYDPNKNFSFEKYHQLHARSHEIFAAAGDPVAEWRKITQFMGGIRCNKLQDDYRGMKDDPRYNTFTSFYNKIAENYRTLVAQKIIKPVSIYKRKINSMTGEHQDGGGRGRGRSRGRGNGRGGQEGSGRYQSGRYGGRSGRSRDYYDSGRGGRGGCGRGRHNGRDVSTVDLSCLPGDINLNNLTFTGDQWYGFDAQQREAINALSSFRNQQRQVNRMGRNHYGDHSRLRDDSSTLVTDTYPPPVRHIYELNISRGEHPLPPRVSDEVLQPPQGGRNNGNNNQGGSVPAQNARSAFGRRSQN